MREKPVLERAWDDGIALTYADVLLAPGLSDVVPRDVNLETRLSRHVNLNIPLLTADMDTVTESEMAIAIAKLGGMGFIWKIPDIARQEEEVSKVKYTLNSRIERPICISSKRSIGRAKKKLAKYGNRFSTLVVVDDDRRVIGLLGRDRMQYAADSDKVLEFMIKRPVTSEKDLGVEEAYKFMKKRMIGKLILVNEEGRLRGLYCWTDVKNIMEGITPSYNRDERGQLRVGANVGVNGFERAERLLKRNCDVLLVGTAHGHSKNVINTVRELKTQFSSYKFDVIAGNVATAEGAKALIDAGADGVKAGVGPGSICTTRIVAGVGVPQVQAIYECAKVGEREGVPINADGGVVYSGDIPKAIGAGAHSVMAGSLFAATKEAPGKIFVYKGKEYKDYRGMGSLGAMQSAQSADRYGQDSSEKLVPEGIEGGVPLRGSLSNVVHQLMGGLRSGMGYVGARDIEELRAKAKFLRVTEAGRRESHPHDVEITVEAPNYKGGGA